MQRLRHFNNLGTARFITFPIYQRQPLLTADSACEAVGNEITRIRTKHGIKLLGYVFMPEHVHLVLLPPDNIELGKIIGYVKGRSARTIATIPGLSIATRKTGGRTRAHVWQFRCYDHNCRSPLATREKIDYCHKNPVLRGLVSDPSEWRWSSYNWYQGARDVPLEVDGIEAP